jgi:glycosyltransferase involved in cell wall biosynthesis
MGRLQELMMEVLYKKSDCLVMVSLEIAESFVKNHGITKSIIKTIYNPYDVAEIETLANLPIVNIEHHNFMSSGRVFVTVGRLTYQKGHWHLIKAFSMLPEDCNAKLLIIGTGEKQSQIKNLIKQLKLEDKVLLAGYQKNPFQYILSSYAYILSSIFEGFPNAMVEAMVCGCPVVAADCKSGPREILFRDFDLNNVINDFRCADYGLISPELSKLENWNADHIDESERKLSQAMNYLLLNEDLREKIKKQGQDRVKMFNYQTCKDNYIEVIEKCTNH